MHAPWENWGLKIRLDNPENNRASRMMADHRFHHFYTAAACGRKRVGTAAIHLARGQRVGTYQETIGHAKTCSIHTAEIAAIEAAL